MIFSVGLLWPLIFLKGGPIPKKEKWLKVGLLGLLNPGISYTLSLIGLTTTTASMSTLIWAIEPALILILAGWILNEKLTPHLVFFSLIAIAGVVFISNLTGSSWSDGKLTGNLLILCGVLCCAFYTVFARQVGQAMDPLFAVTLQQTVALGWALLLLPFEFATGYFERLLQLDSATWFWASISGMLYYALAFWLYLNGLIQLKASTAGIFINLIPIFGIGGAYIFLGERLTFVQWIGAGAILLSVLTIWLWGETNQTSSAISTSNGDKWI